MYDMIVPYDSTDSALRSQVAVPAVTWLQASRGRRARGRRGVLVEKHFRSKRRRRRRRRGEAELRYGGRTSGMISGSVWEDLERMISWRLRHNDIQFLRHVD